MAKLPFAEYRPDVDDTNAKQTRFLRNAVPRADGYGPARDISVFTTALAATCRGYFVARSPSDGTVRIFAGTSTKLYLLDNTDLSWADVSKGAGTYSTLASDSNWTFAQYNDTVIASQKNAPMQSYVIGTSSAFADLAGSPPQAGCVAVVSTFLVASDIASHPLRVQWCDVNAITNWSTGSADYQDLPGGGRVRAHGEISGGVGLICQDGAIRRMVFAPGSDEVFQIQRVRDDFGILAPYSLAFSAGFAIFASTRGVVQIGSDGATSFIGLEKVDRTFLGQHDTSAPAEILSLSLDSSALYLCQACAEPDRNIYQLVYKSQQGNTGLFDKGFVYHWELKRWAPIELSGEYLASASRPGITLEGLDAIAPGAVVITGTANNGSGKVRLTVTSTSTITNGSTRTISGVGGTTEANGTWTVTVIDGTHIDLTAVTYSHAYTSGGVVAGDVDLLPFSLDDVSTASLPDTAAFNSAHKLGFLTGATLEAELETALQIMDGKRMNVNNIRPLTDSATVYGFVRYGDKLSGELTEGDESAMDSDGNCPVLEEGRVVRARVRIPAGTSWTYAGGVLLDVSPAGEF